MSTLDKLSIRGVRSFGTAQRDEQMISFATPITLILGENGCGKTTIIECLKYALIGELPPGCSKGQSFVHDPKIFNVSESLGQVKLQVKNDGGDKVTVCRSMKTSVAKRGAGALKFETLDSTIHVVLNGRHESVSKRCADTNTEMAHVMGVPKAIINNVLFCHQEDSSWPLDEAKKLKERFDEIFGTTEYNKAIDKVLKHRKSYEAKAKEKESELNLLEHLKKDAETRTLDLSTADGKLLTLEETMKRCDESMLPIRERLDKIRTIELEITKLYTNKTEVSTKLGNCKEQQASLSAKIRTPHAGTVAQLDRELHSFKAEQANREADLRQCTDDLTAAKASEKRIQQQLGEMDRQRTTLCVQRQQEQELHDERAGHLQTLCGQLDVTDLPADLQQASAHEFDAVLALTRAAFQREDAALSALAQRHDGEDAAQQAQIDRIREQITQAETGMKSANLQAAQLRQEHGRTQQKIDAVEKMAHTLKSLGAEIAKVDRCYEDCSRNVDLDADRQRIAAQQLAIDELQDQMDVLDVDVSVLSANASAAAELALKQTALEQREADVRRLRHKHADNLQRLSGGDADLPPPPQSNYKRHVQAVGQRLQRDVAAGQKRLATAQQLATELQMQRRTQRTDLQRAERELTDAEERLYEQCHAAAYADVLGRLQVSVGKLQLDHGTLKASEVLYAKYMQRMAAEPCCPLCHTDMTDGRVVELTAELQDEIRRLPEKIESTEAALRTEQSKYETLLGLRSVHERIAVLQADVPMQRERLAATERQLAVATQEADDQQLGLAEPAERLELAQSLAGDMTMLDEALRELDVLTGQLVAIRSRMPARSGTLTLDEAQAQRAALSRTVRADRQAVEKAQAQVREAADKLQRLRERRNQLKDQQHQMQEGVQALAEIRRRLAELETQIGVQRAAAAEHETVLGPLRVQSGAAVAAKAKAREANRRTLAAGSERVAAARRLEREVLRCGAELRRLAALDLAGEIDRLHASTRERQAEQRRAGGAVEDLAARIAALRDQLAGQLVLERDLLDNRELRQLEAEQVALQQQLDALSRDMGDLDFRSVTRERDGLMAQSDRVQMERSECVGQMGELRARVRTLRAELALPRYQDAVRTYLRAYYDAVVLRKVVKDLGTYRVALEWALMSFHTEKMERINQLVKGLWHKIYRGNDIDYIQIRTDEMKVQNVDKRRSYDYRVVQIKNDSELDMRGRCSAGQRVLACLIIRIALAETFSANCGVLTLDEPTTNLDRVNIVSLCQALNALVEERQSQSNFMLVVITHDEEFITTLGRIEHYWKVSRGNTGKSIIEMVSVE